MWDKSTNIYRSSFKIRIMTLRTMQTSAKGLFMFEDSGLFERGKRSATGWRSFESLVYEMKPVFYLFFSVCVLKFNHHLPLWIKYTSMGIAFFAVFTIYSRLVHRGYL